MYALNVVSFYLPVVLYLSTLIGDCSPEVWNTEKCDKGCSETSTKNKCPVNSQCKFITDSTCGVCVCVDGYKPQGNRCIVDKTRKSTSTQSTTTTSTSTPATTTTTSTTSTSTTSTTTTPTTSTSTTTTTTTTAIPTQGSPPAAIAVDCSMFDCGVKLEHTNDTNPLSIRTQNLVTNPPGCAERISNSPVICKTPLASGGTQCNGAYCLPITDTKSYCICSFDKNGESCQEDKRGKCATATGQLPATGFQSTNKRFVNKNDPDNGSIMARHFVTSMSDCMKLCQWTQGQCGSINFGQINGQNICELLSVEAKPTSTILQSWVTDTPGWTYACCFKS